MTVAGVFSAILAVIQAIPAVRDLFERFVSFYVERRIASMKQENRDAIRRAFTEHDQRPLEEALGNPNPGGHSGVPGTQVVDRLPGVNE